VQIYPHLPPDAVKIFLVLFLSFLIGLEREDHKAQSGTYLSTALLVPYD
jgi:uncharacterized membrane protein YhiD involved in acid resistance